MRNDLLRGSIKQLADLKNVLSVHRSYYGDYCAMIINVKFKRLLDMSHDEIIKHTLVYQDLLPHKKKMTGKAFSQLVMRNRKSLSRVGQFKKMKNFDAWWAEVRKQVFHDKVKPTWKINYEFHPYECFRTGMSPKSFIKLVDST